ncbi:MAG: hydrogenase maturation nickel metallochaperone HypA [Clostridia bacterium]|jgi:hydrogenase nickel incorporation protein HypA/HybF|nr:hydrogenase maturation nickel metallochaperone HypA [Clostridia bacterium]MCI9459966.1 hydrogenase maturation nickel metallochaperone HypA [Clostridia bacterium]
MHELGIVMHVVDQVEKVAVENNVERVLKLTLEVGEVSSIVPELFTECFEWAKKKTELLKDTELELILLEAVSYCRDCKKTYKTTEHAKECPHCGSNDTYLVTGNEMNIKDMEVV